MPVARGSEESAIGSGKMLNDASTSRSVAADQADLIGILEASGDEVRAREAGRRDQAIKIEVFPSETIAGIISPIHVEVGGIGEGTLGARKRILGVEDAIGQELTESVDARIDRASAIAREIQDDVFDRAARLEDLAVGIFNDAISVRGAGGCRSGVVILARHREIIESHKSGGRSIAIGILFVRIKSRFRSSRDCF